MRSKYYFISYQITTETTKRHFNEVIYQHHPLIWLKKLQNPKILLEWYGNIGTVTLFWWKELDDYEYNIFEKQMDSRLNKKH